MLEGKPSGSYAAERKFHLEPLRLVIDCGPEIQEARQDADGILAEVVLHLHLRLRVADADREREHARAARRALNVGGAEAPGRGKRRFALFLRLLPGVYREGEITDCERAFLGDASVFAPKFCATLIELITTNIAKRASVVGPMFVLQTALATGLAWRN